MLHNPFTVGKPVPPQSFVGRTSEIAAAFDQIYNRSHLAIWGGPRMGKSSFLEKLASPEVWEEYGLDPSEAAIVLFSCENIVPFTASGFWQEVLSNLKDNEPALQADIERLLRQGQATKDSLRQVLRKLGQKGKFLVLLVDDYDAALYPNEQYTEANMEVFLSECRNLAYHAPERRYLSMIVTSLKRLNELGPKLNLNASPWYNHYLFQSLQAFTKTEVDQLLAGIRTTPALRDAIREIADGHPALLQIAAYLLYIELQTGKVPNAEAFVRDFESTTRQIFENIWARCTGVEQAVLMLIALSGLKGRLHRQRQFDLSDINMIFTQRERELSGLEEQGVIIHTVNEEEKLYSFTSSIMERWVIQEAWNTNDPSVRDREKVFLNLMSHQQAEKVTKTIHWLGQHRDVVPSIVEWLGKVLAAFPKGAL